jgi:hypothetical protein
MVFFRTLALLFWLRRYEDSSSSHAGSDRFIFRVLIGLGFFALLGYPPQRRYRKSS